ncbi:hypothetical protein Esti_004983 [Eimeria stiedai]
MFNEHGDQLIKVLASVEQIRRHRLSGMLTVGRAASWRGGVWRSPVEAEGALNRARHGVCRHGGRAVALMRSAPRRLVGTGTLAASRVAAATEGKRLRFAGVGVALDAPLKRGGEQGEVE